jgi:hypothetical protein
MTETGIQRTLATAVMRPIIENVDQDPLFEWLLDRYKQQYSGHLPGRVTLAHLTVNDHADALESFEIASHTPETARMFVGKIRWASLNHATVRASLERFAVFVEWPTGETIQTLFQVDGSGGRDSARSSGSSLPANPEGVLKIMMTHSANLMNHVETMHRISTGAALEQHSRNLQHIERQDKKIAEQESKRLQLLETGESLLNAKNERELEQIRTQQSEARRNLMFQEFLGIIPIVRNRILEKVTGVKISTGEQNPAAESFRALFGSMNDQQIGALMQTFSLAQRVQFMDSYKQYVMAPAERAELARMEAAREEKERAEAASAAASATAAPAALETPPPADVAALPEPASVPTEK